MPLIQPITTASGTSAFVPLTRTLTINGVSYDLSADRTWTVSGLSGLIATTPLSFNSGTNTISISQAGNSTDGYLSSADWLTFSSKQPAITLTTTGDSGASTFNVTTGALNIPEYTLAGLGGFSNPMTSLGDIIYGNAIGAAVRRAGNTSTTKMYLTQTGDGTNSAAPVWEAITGFVGGSGTTNYVPKFTGSTNLGNSLIFDDGTNVGISNATPAYKLDVSGQVRITDALAIGTTPDTTLPFKIDKNINSTVGIRFQNTNTGSNSFTAVQFGSNVTAGTAFCNLVYASSGITESGVFKPSGTSLVNTGSGGLNFLAVSSPIRFFTSSANGTLRLELANNGFLIHYNGTNPTSSVTDGYSQYSADVTAGNAAPHFRTENGAVIKLYQETTAVGNSIISVGGGSSVLDDTTFDGYTLRQVVKALRNQGILA